MQKLHGRLLIQKALLQKYRRNWMCRACILKKRGWRLITIHFKFPGKGSFFPFIRLIFAVNKVYN
jgi:hypothetical protein